MTSAPALNHRDGQQILAIYEGLSRITRDMLEAARASDWEQLVAHEQAYAAQSALLFSLASTQPQDPAFRRRKTELIRGMLEDDACIRALADPWLSRLSALIGDTRQQTRLLHTYGAAP